MREEALPQGLSGLHFYNRRRVGERGKDCLLILQVDPRLSSLGGFPMAQVVKNLRAMQETPVRFLGWEDPLEKG